MIVYKTWKQIKCGKTEIKARYIWEGWFLFGIIPLYLKRNNVDLSR